MLRKKSDFERWQKRQKLPYKLAPVIVFVIKIAVFAAEAAILFLLIKAVLSLLGYTS